MGIFEVDSVRGIKNSPFENLLGAEPLRAKDPTIRGFTKLKYLTPCQQPKYVVFCSGRRKIKEFIIMAFV